MFVHFLSSTSVSYSISSYRCNIENQYKNLHGSGKVQKCGQFKNNLKLLRSSIPLIFPLAFLSLRNFFLFQTKRNLSLLLTSYAFLSDSIFPFPAYHSLPVHLRQRSSCWQGSTSLETTTGSSYQLKGQSLVFINSFTGMNMWVYADFPLNKPRRSGNRNTFFWTQHHLIGLRV